MSGDPSRPFKWVTVVCSVVTVGFLLAAAVRENVSADWRGHQAVFRGILLSGLRQRLRPVALVITVGLIFGLFHMTLFRIAPTAVLRVILTAIALLTGSIFPGMLLHMGNNAWGVWAGLHDLDADTVGPWYSAAMITIFALSMWVIYRNRVRPGMSHTSS